MAVRRMVGRGPLVETTRGGVRWNLDLGEGIDFAIWLRGCFEPSTLHALQRLVRPGATVLDIGANVGAHTLHLAAAVGSTGRVLAFEPVAESFRKLRTNVAANPSLAAAGRAASDDAPRRRRVGPARGGAVELAPAPP